MEALYVRETRIRIDPKQSVEAFFSHSTMKFLLQFNFNEEKFYFSTLVMKIIKRLLNEGNPPDQKKVSLFPKRAISGAKLKK